MRIGLVIYGDIGYTSGGFLYDRKVVECLQANGDEVVIISLPWRRYGQHLLDNFSWRLYRRLLGLNLDLLIEDELNHPSLFLMNRLIRRRMNAPIVAIVHHLRWQEQHPRLLRWFYRMVEGWYLNGLDGWVSVSETTQRDVTALREREGAFQVCRPGGNRWEGLPNKDEVRARVRRGGALRVVFLGNAIPRKGLHILVEAVMGLPVEECTLTVVGHVDSMPEYTDQIWRRIGRVGGNAQVQFLGAISGDRLREILADADVLAVPSAYEGFGIVYLEGMAFGLPAIGGKEGAAWEIVQDEETGFLVTYGSVGELQNRIRQLAKDRALLERMSVAARDFYDRQPTWENTTECVRNFLRSFAANAIIS